MTYEEKLDEVLEWQKQQAEKDRRIKELEAQIEKMKNCENCKHKDLNYSFRPICISRGWDDIRDIENPLTFKCDKWEIKEK